MAIEIKVPAPGESVSEVTIANWLVKEGEWVEMDAPLAEFESDKATFEVNAEKAGVIEKLIGNIGDTIAINTVIAVINTDAERPASAAPKQRPNQLPKRVRLRQKWRHLQRRLRQKQSLLQPKTATGHWFLQLQRNCCSNITYRLAK